MTSPFAKAVPNAHNASAAPSTHLLKCILHPLSSDAHSFWPVPFTSLPVRRDKALEKTPSSRVAKCCYRKSVTHCLICALCKLGNRNLREIVVSGRTDTGRTDSIVADWIVWGFWRTKVVQILLT